MSVVRALIGGAAAVLVLTLSSAASAQERYALIVSGAAGAQNYADQYARWTSDLESVLVEGMKFDRTHVVVLREGGGESGSATAINVRRAVASVRQRMRRDDLLFICLIGHGTYDGVDAKFNLVGPDMESAEWSSMLDGLPGRIVLVNSTSASFPFLERLAGPRRIVITATDTPAQRFDTVFPEYFIKAFSSEAADIDKNGRVSIWEAFASAANDIRRYYQQRGQLATERPLLDDNGDGVGHEPVGASDDGSQATRTYLDQPAPGAPPTDDVLLQLLQKRAALESEFEDLKIRKAFLTPSDYQKEFERLMVDLAKVGRDIRARTGGSES
jgi:hypothetical protein